MSHDRLPPPDPAACLVRRYSSSQKGGTLIAEEVVDRATHERRLCDPDGYRPGDCPSCGHEVLHVHDYRERVLLADPERPVVRVVRHLCVACEATWRVLPQFVARHLWRSWRVVEAETMEEKPARARPPVPKRTVRRWRTRLRMAARLLVQVLATSGSAALDGIAHAVGLDGTRADLVAAHAVATGSMPGRRMAELAALVHRLAPGVRLV